MNEALFKYLSEFVMPERLNAFNEVASKRTRYITVALENIYQSQNASAVLRSCDCFGVQDLHIIENTYEYKINPDVALGSSKWLDLHKYNKNSNNTLEAIQNLRSKGYRIVATTPHTNDISLHEFDLQKGPVALFFGTELEGLSDIVLDNADEFLKIPMVGFTESFNISVSAAITLYDLTMRLRNSDFEWKLPSEEELLLKIQWLRTSIKMIDSIEKRFQELYSAGKL